MNRTLERRLRRADQHYVDDGTVTCPTRGLVDLDVCITCPHALDVDLGDGVAVLYCDPPRRSSFNDAYVLPM
jgi:hypothetical protein